MRVLILLTLLTLLPACGDKNITESTASQSIEPATVLDASSVCNESILPEQAIIFHESDIYGLNQGLLYYPGQGLATDISLEYTRCTLSTDSQGTVTITHKTCVETWLGCVYK